MFRFDTVVSIYPKIGRVETTNKNEQKKVSVTAESYFQARRKVLEKVWSQGQLVNRFVQVHKRGLRGRNT